MNGYEDQELPGMPPMPHPATQGRELILSELVWMVSSSAWPMLDERAQKAIKLAIRFLTDDLALNPGHY